MKTGFSMRTKVFKILWGI